MKINKSMRMLRKYTLKNKKGITLVALVITIIILLILAGITISQLTGSGLFENAKQAEQKSKNAQEKEEETLSDYSNLIEGIVGTRNDVVTISTSELTNLITKIVEEKSGVPTGNVISQMGNEAPTGYLICDGTTYNISDYPILANYIKDQFGSYNYFGGDGQTTFAVPDLRGEFLRGTDTATRNTGTGAAVGVHQNPTQHINSYIGNYGKQMYSTIKAGDGSLYNANMDKGFSGNTGMIVINGTYGTNSSYSTISTTYTSRPTNTSVLYCIKY